MTGMCLLISSSSRVTIFDICFFLIVLGESLVYLLQMYNLYASLLYKNYSYNHLRDDISLLFWINIQIV
jgi:hypothetical protein